MTSAALLKLDVLSARYSCKRIIAFLSGHKQTMRVRVHVQAVVARRHGRPPAGQAGGGGGGGDTSSLLGLVARVNWSWVTEPFPRPVTDWDTFVCATRPAFCASCTRHTLTSPHFLAPASHYIQLVNLGANIHSYIISFPHGWPPLQITTFPALLQVLFVIHLTMLMQESGAALSTQDDIQTRLHCWSKRAHQKMSQQPTQRGLEV